MKSKIVSLDLVISIITYYSSLDRLRNQTTILEFESDVSDWEPYILSGFSQTSIV